MASLAPRGLGSGFCHLKRGCCFDFKVSHRCSRAAGQMLQEPSGLDSGDLNKCLSNKDGQATFLSYEEVTSLRTQNHFPRK